jgi:hypothetical protein
LQQTVTRSEVSPPGMFKNTSFTTVVGSCIQPVINNLFFNVAQTEWGVLH